LRALQENSLTKGKLGHESQIQSKVTLLLVYGIGSRLNSLMNLYQIKYEESLLSFGPMQNLLPSSLWR